VALTKGYGHRLAASKSLSHSYALLPTHSSPLTHQPNRAPQILPILRENSVNISYPYHSPIKPAVGYRFDYKCRSVVISGVTIVTDRLREVIDDADLLFSDALSLPIVNAMEVAAGNGGQPRLVHILKDIQDYHASVTDIAELTRTTGVGMTALYHMVPGPRNTVMENFFRRELEDNMLLTEDGMRLT